MNFSSDIIAEELKIFESAFKDSVKSNVPLLDRIMRYVVKRKGKQLRPMFVLLSAKLTGTINESTYRAASLVELLHTASLIHDDVVDEAMERRGFFSVYALWKTKISVLVGDYLLAKGLLLSIDHNDIRILQILSEAVRQISEGELIQIEKSRNLNLSESTYFEIIRHKTASLLASACAAGAYSASNNEETTSKMREFGELVGIAFQIKDDLFDYGDAQVGKPTGNDIKEKKLTLPLIYTLNKVDKPLKRELIYIIKNQNRIREKVDYIIENVRAAGGIDYSIQKMNDYRDRALAILREFPQSESREHTTRSGSLYYRAEVLIALTSGMEKTWKKIDAPIEKVKDLQQVLHISTALCEILVQRGIEDFESAKNYFRPQLKDLYDPWLMKDMEKAVRRIISAIHSKEKILVFGDYDVDGTTAVACMYQFLCDIYENENLAFYVPHRYREGYGVSKQGIDFANENGFSFIISLDCGIKSSELIAYALSLGIEFIICDHHLPGDELPPAVAILNPKQKDCNYPYKELCGCGIGFKLITAMAQRLGLPEEKVWYFLDLTATAIAADIVPITGENRILTFYGLQRVNEDPCAGIQALIKLSGLQKSLHINTLVFIIAPRVNAAGRMDDARKAVLLFIEKDPLKALEYAEMLHEDNAERKEADSSITEEALALINNSEILVKKKSTVVYQPHWHKGVVGIVASRLIEHYYRPTIVLTQSGGVLSGSARSIPGFNIHEGLHSCRDLLLGFGGHYFAAGMTLLPENLELFSNKFEEVVSALISDQLLVPVIMINAELQFSDIKAPFYNVLNQMEPFGPENLRPIFLARNVEDYGWSKIVKEDHIRFVLKQDKTIFKGIGFNMAYKFPLINMRKPLDIVFTLDENEWNGEKHLQLKVIDFRLSA